MPGERVPMRKIRDVLRLGWGQGLSQRVIGRSLRLSQGVVHAYLSARFERWLDWLEGANGA
jgi:hypothetical protein